MKNIRTSIFCTMVIATSVFGSDHYRGYQSQAQVALQKTQAELELHALKVELELQKLKAERDFRQCLLRHSYSFSIGSSLVKTVCASEATMLRLLGGGSEVDKLMEKLTNKK